MILGVIVVAVDLSQTIGKNMSLPLYQNNQVQNVHIMYNSTVDYHWLEAFVRQTFFLPGHPWAGSSPCRRRPFRSRASRQTPRRPSSFSEGNEWE